MRKAFEMTKDERQAAENALASLELAYSQGRILRGAYLMRKELLESNLKRVVSANTAIEKNAKGFFNRDELNLSARPIGYETKNITEGFTNQARPNEIRRALIELSRTDYQTSIMDHLQEHKNHTYTDAILHAGNLSGINQATYPDIWNEISSKPGVISALQRLANAVQGRIQGAIQQGMSPKSAEVYIINNARAAGASLSQEGYDRRRASEIVQRVISGEISLIAASNIVVGDLNDASRAILASTPDYVLNPNPTTSANSTQLARMSLKDIMETRATALAMLEDPLSYDEELQWAAQFIQEANIAISQRDKQIDRITGNSTNDIMVSTDPANYSLLNANEGLPSTLQTTRNIVQGGPDLNLVLNDIFSVDGISYYDHRTDTFTVVAHTPDAIPVLEEILRAINYALGSPYFKDEERAILEAVRQRVTSHISSLGPYKPPHGKPIPNNLENNLSINPPNNPPNNPPKGDKKSLTKGKPEGNPFQVNVYDLEDKKMKSLGASNSTTTSSRTSGAHRFTVNEDPRDRHRME